MKISQKKSMPFHTNECFIINVIDNISMTDKLNKHQYNEQRPNLLITLHLYNIQNNRHPISDDIVVKKIKRLI